MAKEGPRSPDLDRRALMWGGAAVGLCAGLGCGLDSGGLADLNFPLGVASGEVTPTSAVLWTHYRGPRPLRLTVWRDDGKVALAREAAVGAGGAVHVKADGLGPGRVHRYAFDDGVRSAEGQLRAAIAPESSERLVFGVTSCLRNRQPLGTLRTAAARGGHDLFVLLGDTVYADGAKDLPGYRQKWAENLSTPSFRALRASTSLLCSWDDHEVQNDWSAETVSKERLAQAKAAFFEHTPLEPGRERLWRSARWGRTAELFMLDVRSERRPSTLGTPKAQYVSPEQLAWLAEGLASSPAVFKLVMSPVPVGDFPGGFQAAKADRWEGYRAQRDLLLEHIEAQRLRGVLFVSGDFHLGSLGRVSASGPGAGLWEVLAGPAAVWMPNPLASELRRPQFEFATPEENVVELGLDPAARQVEVRWFGREGHLLARRLLQL
jgi:alkaline phosphatase D